MQVEPTGLVARGRAAAEHEGSDHLGGGDDDGDVVGMLLQSESSDVPHTLLQSESSERLEDQISTTSDNEVEFVESINGPLGSKARKRHQHSVDSPDRKQRKNRGAAPQNRKLKERVTRFRSFLLEPIATLREIWQSLGSPYRFRDAQREEKFRQDFLFRSFASKRMMTFLGLPAVVVMTAADLAMSFSESQPHHDQISFFKLRCQQLINLFLIFVAAAYLADFFRVQNEVLSGANRPSLKQILRIDAVLKVLLALCLLVGNVHEHKFYLFILFDAFHGMNLQHSLEERMTWHLHLIFARMAGSAVEASSLSNHVEHQLIQETFKQRFMVDIVIMLFSWCMFYCRYAAARQKFLLRVTAESFKLVVPPRSSLPTNVASTSVADNYYSHAEWESIKQQAAEAARSFDLTAAKRRDNSPSDQTFVMTKLLGNGTYGGVYLAVNPDTGEESALKDCRLAAKPDKAVKVLETEIKILMGLDHPNIVQIKHARVENSSLQMLLEHCEDGSLETILKQGPLDDGTCRMCLVHILAAIDYVHLHSITHGDVKPGNILIKDGYLKLSDFGSSTWVTNSGQASFRGSLAYMPPEVFQCRAYHGRKVDIWALGCCTVQFLSGGYWQELRGKEISAKTVMKLKKPPTMPDFFAPTAGSFIGRCLTIKESERPTAWALKSDAYVRGVGLAKIHFAALTRKQAKRKLEDGASNSYSYLASDIMHWSRDIEGTFVDPEIEKRFMRDYAKPRMEVLLMLARLEMIIRAITDIMIGKNYWHSFLHTTTGLIAVCYPFQYQTRKSLIRAVAL